MIKSQKYCILKVLSSNPKPMNAQIEKLEAQEENNMGALRSFRFANEVEKVHHDLYQKALDSLGSNGETDYYICDICGYTAEGSAPDECPVCKAKAKAFRKID